eukprot:151593_1
MSFAFTATCLIVAFNSSKSARNRSLIVSSFCTSSTKASNFFANHAIQLITFIFEHNSVRHHRFKSLLNAFICCVCEIDPNALADGIIRQISTTASLINTAKSYIMRMIIPHIGRTLPVVDVRFESWCLRDEDIAGCASIRSKGREQCVFFFPFHVLLHRIHMPFASYS